MKAKQNTPKHKRHCMIVHAYYPLGETRVQREAEALLKRGYEVDIICLRYTDEPATEVFKGARVYRLPVKRHKRSGLLVQLFEYLAFFFLVMLKVSRLHWRQRYGTIQAHNPPDFLVFAAWMPRLLGARLILDLHDLMPEFYTGRFQRDANSLPVRLARLQELLSCSFAHRVITVSHNWQQVLADRGVDKSKTSVVMNVADDTIFCPPKNFQRLVPTKDGLNLIYHGNVTYRYGLDLALQAMVQLREQAPNIHLTILGGGDYMEPLIKMADELSLDSQVTFRWEFRPAEELPEIIMTADAGIVPYRNDPFTDSLVPTKLMEYAALGMPSIASRTTAIEYYFENTMVEFFTPGSVDDLARCMMRLYTDRKHLRELAQGTERFSQKYSWSKISAEYVAMVESLGRR